MREVLHVRLHNRFAAFTFPFPVEELKQFFQFKPKGYNWIPKFRMGVWDGNISLLRNGKVGAGLFLAMRGAIEKGSELRFKVKDERQYPEFHHKDPRDIKVPAKFEIRDYQRGAVLAMMEASNVGGLVLNATGTGKTVTAGLYFKNLKGCGLFVVDELTLLDQAQKELAEVLGEQVGIVGSGKFEPGRVTVATVQTLHLHRKRAAFRRWAQTVAVMLIDEIHMMLNKRQADVVRVFQPLAVFGLTATLQLKKQEVRLKAQDLCGPVVFTYPYEQGVKDHVLSPGVVVGVDLQRETEARVDYAWLYLERIVRSPRRNQVVTELVREGYHRGRFIVVLVERVRHLKLLSRMLRDIPHAVVYGEMPAKERIRVKHQFDAGKVRLLLCNKVFKKGVNLKRLDVIIDAASMYDENDAVQKYGRGVRLSDQKEGLIYFDIGDRKPKDRSKVNRFTAATKSRRKALAGIGVQVLPMLARVGCTALYDAAEKTLRQVLESISPKQQKLIA